MPTATYDQATLAVACPRCGRPPLQRCMPPSGNTLRAIPPHRARVLAGQQQPAPANG